jgi:hypothetical protein
MIIDEGDTIITAFAESASGPGWANYPIWVVVRDSFGDIREECIQMDEQTYKMLYLYDVSSAAHKSMTSAVNSLFKGNRNG